MAKRFIAVLNSLKLVFDHSRWFTCFSKARPYSGPTPRVQELYSIILKTCGFRYKALLKVLSVPWTCYVNL